MAAQAQAQPRAAQVWAQAGSRRGAHLARGASDPPRLRPHDQESGAPTGTRAVARSQPPPSPQGLPLGARAPLAVRGAGHGLDDTARRRRSRQHQRRRSGRRIRRRGRWAARGKVYAEKSGRSEEHGEAVHAASCAFRHAGGATASPVRSAIRTSRTDARRRNSSTPGPFDRPRSHSEITL